MKKLLALLMVACIIFVLAACTSAQTTATVKVTTKDGAGEKTIVVSIPKKDADGNPDDEQEKFFPAGFDAVTDFIQETLGSDYTVSFEELDESWDYTVKFSFSDIDDYNAKMRAMMTDTTWADVALEEVATISAEETDGGYNVTFKESVHANKAATQGIMERLHEQPDIFDPTRGAGGDAVCGPDGNEVLKVVEVIVGDKSDKLESTLADPDKSLVDEGDDRFLEVTGFVSADAEPPVSEEPSGEEPVDESPATGDNGIVFMAFMLLASAAVVLSKKMVKAN